MESLVYDITKAALLYENNTYPYPEWNYVDMIVFDIMDDAKALVHKLDARMNKMTRYLSTNLLGELECTEKDFIKEMEDRYKSFFAGHEDCKCVMELMEKYDYLNRICNCTSCEGGDPSTGYPHCDCNPWEFELQ